MVIDYEGQVYELHLDAVTVRQAIEIFRFTGMSMADFERSIKNPEQDARLLALSCLFWLMTGCSIPLQRVEFKYIPFQVAVTASFAEETELRESKERREHGGLTRYEFYVELSKKPNPSFMDQLEVKKYFSSFGEAEKYFNEWYNKNVAELRNKYCWDFGKVFKWDTEKIDRLRVIDFFLYCNSLEQHKKFKQRKAEQKNNQQ